MFRHAGKKSGHDMGAWFGIPFVFNVFPQSFVKDGLNLTPLLMGHLT